MQFFQNFLKFPKFDHIAKQPIIQNCHSPPPPQISMLLHRCQPHGQPKPTTLKLGGRGATTTSYSNDLFTSFFCTWVIEFGVCAMFGWSFCWMRDITCLGFWRAQATYRHSDFCFRVSKRLLHFRCDHSRCRSTGDDDVLQQPIFYICFCTWMNECGVCEMFSGSFCWMHHIACPGYWGAQAIYRDSHFYFWVSLKLLRFRCDRSRYRYRERETISYHYWLMGRTCQGTFWWFRYFVYHRFDTVWYDTVRPHPINAAACCTSWRAMLGLRRTRVFGRTFALDHKWHQSPGPPGNQKPMQIAYDI